MSEKLLSSQFESELAHATARMLEMGGLVESQLRQCIYALHHLSLETVQQVLQQEALVNNFEVEIDYEITSTMSRRQPTARDLRLLVALSRVVMNLERVGDKAARIAKLIRSHIQAGAPRALPSGDLESSLSYAIEQLHQTLDAFARLDAHAANTVINSDDRLDEDYAGYTRKLITYMMEDPRTIGSSLNLLFLAKAIERVGDHAKNIAEATIYVVKGADVRHASEEERKSALQ